MADERPVNLKAFEKLPAGEPVVMINLLKFDQPGGHESNTVARWHPI